MDRKMENKSRVWSEADFCTPDATFGAAPFWAWNDTMTPGGIREKLHMLHESGFGGAFIHPRPGLTNEYLSEEWFKLWGVALETARTLGMKLYIYDENTYPTGYAGGEVMALLPDCAARSAKVYVLENGQALRCMLDDPALPEDTRAPLCLYAASSEGGSLRLAARADEWTPQQCLAYEGPFVAVLRGQPYASAWFGGFPNPDILQPEVTKALLETTYEAYARHFGAAFGDTILAAFSDEPGISPGGVWMEDPDAFPFSRYLAAEFRARRGYPLEENMVCLALDVTGAPGGPPATKVRYDYYCTLRELWVENFAAPLGNWCAQRGIAWTGHFLDEHWPWPWGCCSPAVMSLYEYMQWPGIDMLMSSLLREDGETAMLLPLCELASAGAQLGKERLVCECYGAGGWDATLADFKRIGDWLAANGITFFVPHLTLHSLAGERKHEHPQSLDDREPWWEEYGELTRYQSRLSYALSLGKAVARVLVLHPTTSWFMQCPRQAQGDLLWRPKEMPQQVQRYVALLQALHRAQIPFDLGDEFLLERYGRVESGALAVGQCTYDVVLVPPQMENIRAGTLSLVEKAVENGVLVLHMGAFPRFVDGVAHDVVLPGTQQIDNPVDWLAARGFSLMEVEGGGAGVSCRVRRLHDGEVWFLANSAPRTAVCTLPARVGGWEHWDAFTGKKRPLEAQWVKGPAGELCPRITLAQNGSLLLRCTVQSHGDEMPALERHTGIVNPTRRRKASLRRVQRLSPNVLVLDYCTLTLRGVRQEELYVLAASDEIYHAYGYEQNPWDMAVQFRRRALERVAVCPRQGFEAAFSFRCAGGPLSALRLAAERPELCRVVVNGVSVPWIPGETWLDHHTGVAELGAAVHPGENTVTLVYDRFDVCAELQPVYLLGDFSVCINGDHFELKPPCMLTEGGLKEQGLPFYGGRIRYTYSVTLPAAVNVNLVLPEHRASAVSIFVNGVRAGQADMGENGVFPLAQGLRPGENEITLELSCSLKNMLGPHHTVQPVRNSAWPAAWRQAPRRGRPPAGEYDVIDYGVWGNPTLLYEAER